MRVTAGIFCFNTVKKFCYFGIYNYICGIKQQKNKQMERTQFSDAQLALLDLLSMNMSKSELNELKTLLSNFCAELAQRKINKLESEGKFPSPEKIKGMRMRLSSVR
jgi:hypothetical protein